MIKHVASFKSIKPCQLKHALEQKSTAARGSRRSGGPTARSTAPRAPWPTKLQSLHRLNRKSTTPKEEASRPAPRGADSILTPGSEAPASADQDVAPGSHPGVCKGCSYHPSLHTTFWAGAELGDRGTRVDSRSASPGENFLLTDHSIDN